MIKLWRRTHDKEPAKEEGSKLDRDKRLSIGLYEPSDVKLVRKAYEYIKDRIPPMWAIVLTVDRDAQLVSVTMKDGRGKVVKRLGYKDVVKDHGYFKDNKPDYEKHVKWAWKWFRKTGE